MCTVGATLRDDDFMIQVKTVIITFRIGTNMVELLVFHVAVQILNPRGNVEPVRVRMLIDRGMLEVKLVSPLSGSAAPHYST